MHKDPKTPVLQENIIMKSHWGGGSTDQHKKPDVKDTVNRNREGHPYCTNKQTNIYTTDRELSAGQKGQLYVTARIKGGIR